MVLSNEGEEFRAGGAGNVARNLRQLGAEVTLLGVVGMDARGRELLRLLDDADLERDSMLQVADWTTPTKTRVLAAEPHRTLKHVMRIDREPREPVEPELQHEIAKRLRALKGQVDAVLIADYDYGVVGEPIGKAARELADQGAIVVLDPRVSIDPFAGLTAMTPNMDELARFSGASLESLEEPISFHVAATRLMERVRTRWLLVTRGNLGMSLFGEGLPPNGVSVAASGSDEVKDVCGAGDTAAAVFALSLASGTSATDAMILANAASGVVVMEHGAAVCSPQQLRAALPVAPQPAARASSGRA